MALNAYLTLTGETQGAIEGPSTLEGREGMVEVFGFSHEVISPRDAASGLPTGKRQHKPITIVKPIDKASPQLMSMFVGNENITDWSLRLYRPNATGAQEQFYTLQLQNASVAAIRIEQLNNKYPENVAHEVREHVTFTYGRITWTYTDGGITAEDNWETPAA